MSGPSLATALDAEPRAPTFHLRAEAAAAEHLPPTQMIKTEIQRTADASRAAGDSSSRRLDDVLFGFDLLQEVQLAPCASSPVARHAAYSVA